MHSADCTGRQSRTRAGYQGIDAPFSASSPLQPPTQMLRHKMVETLSLIWGYKNYFPIIFTQTLPNTGGETPKAKMQTYCNLVSTKPIAHLRRHNTAMHVFFSSHVEHALPHPLPSLASLRGTHTPLEKIICTLTTFTLLSL